MTAQGLKGGLKGQGQHELCQPVHLHPFVQQLEKVPTASDRTGFGVRHTWAFPLTSQASSEHAEMMGVWLELRR